MSQRSDGIFGDLDDFRKRRDQNRQDAYGKKVFAKLCRRLLSDPVDQENMIKEGESAEQPLSLLDDYVAPFKLYSFRFQKWDLNQFMSAPNNLLKSPVFGEMASVMQDCYTAYPDRIPALFFYNSVLAKDMVMHAGIHTRNPIGFFRLLREASSGEGGVVVDLFDGFLEVLCQRGLLS